MVETGDNTLQPIEQINKVALSHVGQKGKVMNVCARLDNNEKIDVCQADR